MRVFLTINGSERCSRRASSGSLDSHGCSCATSPAYRFRAAERVSDGVVLAALASAVFAYAVGMFTYDALSFTQVSLVLFVLLAIGSALVLAADPIIEPFDTPRPTAFAPPFAPRPVGKTGRKLRQESCGETAAAPPERRQPRVEQQNCEHESRRILRPLAPIVLDKPRNRRPVEELARRRPRLEGAVPPLRPAARPATRRAPSGRSQPCAFWTV